VNLLSAIYAAMSKSSTSNLNWRYYISSVPSGVKKIAEAVLSHWGVENQQFTLKLINLQEYHLSTNAWIWNQISMILRMTTDLFSAEMMNK
jgi:hypothetical protein